MAFWNRSHLFVGFFLPLLLPNESPGMSSGMKHIASPGFMIHYSFFSEVTSVAKTAVETVSSIVMEWRKICQTDYEQSGTLDIQTVFGMMKEIINWRSQITSLKLSLEEVKKLNYKIALKVDVGNRMLGADLVVRDTYGNELQADNCSVTELYKYHLATVERIAAEMGV
ncbi:hypothetical protein TTRE_0000652601 [Trichuris trichiura]|uniref:Dedicator of cytokinesis N-terminal domain-containing protein n=1 Tax=Trichuris trichiura TaxID=36087 RepID=A0A077ZEG4_TRITR|nr:hypothetical protein TTRE_0000652601 [Trichuris trichiura]